MIPSNSPANFPFYNQIHHNHGVVHLQLSGHLLKVRHHFLFTFSLLHLLKGSSVNALPISQSSPGGARGCRRGARLHRPWRTHRPELQEWKHSGASACQQSGQYLQHHTNKGREKWGGVTKSRTRMKANMRKYDRSSEKLKWNHLTTSGKTECFVFGPV